MTTRPFLLVPLLLALPACGDPVTDDAIAALPGEVPGIPKGPMHRGGQPCGLCHSSLGGRSPTLTVAGTVYQKQFTLTPVEGAVLHITDATGTSMDLTSNCAGNFYVTDSQWQPVFPLFTELKYAPTGTDIKMTTKVGRDGSCAICHADPVGPDATGHLYLTSNESAQDFPIPPLDCGR